MKNFIIKKFVKNPDDNGISHKMLEEFEKDRVALNRKLSEYDDEYKNQYGMFSLSEGIHMPNSDYLDEVRIGLFLHNFVSNINKERKYFDSDNVIELCLICITSPRRITWTDILKSTIMQDVNYLLQRVVGQERTRVNYIRESTNYKEMLNQ